MLFYYVETSAAVENHRGLTSTTKLIGGWAYPEDDYVSKYNIN